MRIDPRYLRLLWTEVKTVLLGMVTEEGDILLRLASEDTPRGHADWCKLEPDLRPEFGFSLIVAHGRVQVIMKASTLNPPESDFLLPQDVSDEVEALLPLDDSLRQYGH